jgi:hypothetical protein
MFKRYTALTAAILGLAVFAPGASADPLGAKSSLVIPATCDGQSAQAVVNGNGEFTPAHVLGSTSVFIPEAFDTTFELTPTGGATQTEIDTSSKSHLHGALVTCSFDVTFPVPGGTAHLSGSVVGFFTPAS